MNLEIVKSAQTRGDADLIKEIDVDNNIPVSQKPKAKKEDSQDVKPESVARNVAKTDEQPKNK